MDLQVLILQIHMIRKLLNEHQSLKVLKQQF